MTIMTYQNQGDAGKLTRNPRIVPIQTTSTLTQATTAGWFNNNPIGPNSGLTLYNSDLVELTYNYGSATQTTVLCNVAISASNVVTLSVAESDVILPTIANHIATYTNTVGTLSEDPATAISGGNIQAGLSGTAGSLISYPATASKGSLIVAAVANTGNTTTTLSNDAMGQDSTINIPDPGNAVGQLLIGATSTPLVNGNLVQASGTSGLVVDSGIPAVNYQPLTAIVTLTAANVIAMYATPHLIVAAPASGMAIIPISCQIITLVSTAFTSGGNAQLQWGSTAHAGGTLALDAVTPTAEITAASSQLYTQYGIATTSVTAIASVNGLGLYFSNVTQAFATGTGSTVTVAVTYMTVPV